MRYMNDFDLWFARRRFTRASTPNRLALVMVVEELRDWTNNHSDGWAYWTPPRRAAQRAIDHIYSTTNAANDKQEATDITDAEMHKAVVPIKSFLTKHRHLVTPEARELILRSVTL